MVYGTWTARAALRFAVGLLLCCAPGLGCDKPAATKADATTSPDAAQTDAVADDADAAVATDAATGSDVVLPELPPEEDALSCPGSDHCPCSTNADCTSGFCAETADGLRCAPLCISTCPADTRCKSTSGDVQSFCAPLGVRDCAPCESAADCNGLNAMPAACVALGAAGSFCATTCQVTDDCPAGSTCGLVAGQTGKVCLPDGGLQACTCSAWATTAKASTRCSIPQGTLSCPGERSCGENGLSECVQLANEVCIDVGCADASDGTPCDDADPCTADSTCKAGSCQGGVGVCECKTSADCTAKEDGNLCNGTLFCDQASHTCKVNPATVVSCPKPAGLCEVASCDAQTGQCSVEALPDNAACDDGKSCTLGDYCSSGKCVSGTVTCVCNADSDCAAYEDGNQCNGKLFCNKVKGQCQVNPATIVVCPSGLDTTCSQNVCEPVTGACVLSTSPTTTLCDDDNPCTGSDHCSEGSCVSSVDICPCSNDGDCAGQEDGNLCNGTLYCDLTSKTCKVNPKTVVVCAETSDNPCAPIECQPKSGKCVASPVLAGSCDDGDPCTAPGNCAAGVCQPGPGICQCKTSADCAAFDDANLCNGQYFCDTKLGECKINPLTVVDCPASGNACVRNACDPASGACNSTFAPNGAQCEDGIPCTTGDACAGGSCTAGASSCGCLTDSDCVASDDGNLCNGTWFCDVSTGNFQCAFNPASIVQCSQTGLGPCEVNACQPATGTCAVENKPVACSDGDVCTEGDVCADRACQPGTAVSCGDDTQCRDFFCQSAGNVGCTFANKTGICTDNNACTAGDSCAGGNCISGTTITCTDDGDPCTAELCDAKVACTFTFSTASCEDGDACTTGDVCASGTCTAGVARNCDDTNVCTADSCEPATGCKHVPIKSKCDDNNVCTTDDTCQGASCVGTAVACDDGEPCTLESCETGIGCQYYDSDNNCDDNNACTLGDVCSKGICMPGEVLQDCNDLSVCTSEACDPAKGCVTTPLLPPCTTSADCLEGYCDGQWCVIPNGPCSDGLDCTADSCSSVTGCVHASVVDGASCDDLAVCEENGSCNAGLCVGSAKSCDDNNACTSDSCDLATGACVQSNVPDWDACDDGNVCTTGDSCQSGVCVGTDALASAVWTGGTTGTQDEVSAIVPLGDDDAFFAYRTWSEEPYRWDIRLTRLTAGSVSWSSDYAAEGDDVLSAGVYAHGKVWLVGKTTDPGAAFAQGWLVIINPADNSVVQYRFGSADSSFSGVAKTAAGIAVVGTTQTTSDGVQGWLMLFDNTGVHYLSKTYGDITVDDGLTGVAVSGSRIGMIGTRRVGCCSSDVWFVAATTAGNQTAERTFGSDGYDIGFAIAEVSNGWLLGASVSGAPYASDSDRWALRLNYAGQLLWDRAYNEPGDQYIGQVSVQRDASGSVLGLLYAGNSFDENGAIYGASIDTVGTERWVRWLGSPTADEGGRAIAASAKRIWLGGYADSAGERNAALFHTDAFGQDSCADAGSCIQKELTDCGDAEACTLDACTAGSCTHTTLDETARCDDGLPCSMNDSCKGGKCTAGVLADYDGDGQAPMLCGGMDCDDANNLIGDGFTEICDNASADNDCDGLAADPGCSCPAGWQAVATSATTATCAPQSPVWGKRAPDSNTYFRVDSLGTMVHDRQTKLTWFGLGTPVTYSSAASTCMDLIYEGYSDWRLPTFYELWSIVSTPSVPPVAGKISLLLSGSTYWAYELANGLWPSLSVATGALGQTNVAATTNSLVCVRGGVTPFKGDLDLVNKGDGSWLHQATGLYWTAADGGEMSWTDATVYCLGLQTAGRKWRLPQHTELAGLVKLSSQTGAWTQANMLTTSYWSMQDHASEVWLLDFAGLQFQTEANTALHQVRCVSGIAACASNDDCDDGDGTGDYCDPFTNSCVHSSFGN